VDVRLVRFPAVRDLANPLRRSESVKARMRQPAEANTPGASGGVAGALGAVTVAAGVMQQLFRFQAKRGRKAVQPAFMQGTTFPQEVIRPGLPNAISELQVGHKSVRQGISCLQY
jgi:hypothetical protein